MPTKTRAPLPFVLALSLWTVPALAQDAEPGALPAPMTAEAFESYATGRTLFYGLGGEIYGAEQYLPGREVIWAFTGEECRRGRWFPAGERICFVYEDDPETHCWSFFDTGAGLVAEFAGDPPGAPFVEVGQSGEDLFCPGPNVGV